MSVSVSRQFLGIQPRVGAGSERQARHCGCFAEVKIVVLMVYGFETGDFYVGSSGDG